MNSHNDTDFEISEKIQDICYKAREAWFSLANLTCDKRNEILVKIAQQIENDKEIIFAANKIDLEEGEKNNLSKSMLDRLLINEKRIMAIKESIMQIKDLEDPLGKVLEKTIRPNKLEISKISVPIGVMALIYESRPNVTVEASALAIKSGNSIILKGGKEAYHTNKSFLFSISQALKDSRISTDCVSLIPFKERSATMTLLQQKEYVDLVIPRGGEGLINFVTQNSLIPVIKHYKGLCHLYIDSEADIEKAISITINAKVQRPGVCNAIESLLIHQDIVETLFNPLIKELKENQVNVKGCEKTLEIDPSLEKAVEADWDTEYLDKILSVKIVTNLNEAISHIEKHGSRHSEAIITENKITASKFIQNVDASAVFVNSSTRFNDGFEFGLGAELGISTDKLHARGPMGIREMTTYKYIVVGDGQIRE